MSNTRDQARALRRLGASYAVIGVRLGIPSRRACRWTRDVPVEGDVVIDIDGRAWPKWTEARRPSGPDYLDGSGI